MGMFTKATKDNLYLRMSLSGVAGSGKTWTALTFAKTLAKGRPIAVLDTEYGSARKYADRFAFDVLELTSFHPDRYVEAIKGAAAEGYAVIVLDSLTHAWKGKDGILELVSAIEKRKFNGGKNIAAWADVKPIETRLVEAIIRTPIHIIATMRTTADYVTEENAQGRKVMRKVGLKSEQREGFDYEFDVAAMMTDANEMIVQKSRCPDLSGAVISKPGADVAEILRAWLSSTSATTTAAPQPTPVPLPVQQRTPQQMQEDLDASDEANDDGIETIPYTLEPEPETPPAVEEWKFLQDVEFRQVLNKLNIRTVAAIEEFVFAACADHGSSPQREIAMQAARDLLAKRQPQKATRGRGPSALGATLAPGETIPDSLAELPVGAKGA